MSLRVIIDGRSARVGFETRLSKRSKVEHPTWDEFPIETFDLAEYQRSPSRWWSRQWPGQREALAAEYQKACDRLRSLSVEIGVNQIAIATLTSERGRANLEKTRTAEAAARIEERRRAFNAARLGSALCPCCRTIVLDSRHIDRQSEPLRREHIEALRLWYQASESVRDASNEIEHLEEKSKRLESEYYTTTRAAAEAATRLHSQDARENGSLVGAIKIVQGKDAQILIDAREATLDPETTKVIAGYPRIVDVSDPT